MTLIAVGKLKENYWKSTEAEYRKRLGTFVKLAVREIPESAFTDEAGAHVARKKEEKYILASVHAAKADTVIALDCAGEEVSSEIFAKKLQDHEHHGMHLAFLVGGPTGFDERVFKNVQKKISLSHLTFTHQMARIIFFEQLYRACMINHKQSYHY